MPLSRWLPNLSLRSQWAVVLALFAILILFASGIVAYRITYRSAEQDALNSLQSAAAARTELIKTILDHHQQRLAAAAAGVVNSCDSGVINSWCTRGYLRDFMHEEHGVGIRMGYGKDQQVTVGSFNATTVPPGPTAVFERAGSGQLFYTLRQVNQEFGIVLEEQLSPAELASPAGMQDRGTVDVFARVAGRPVALMGAVPIEASSRCDVSRMTTIQTSAGETFYAVTRPVPGIDGGCVVAARTAAEVIAPVNRLKERLFSLGIVFSLLAIVLAWVLAAIVTHPLTILRRRVKQLEKGEFTQIPVIGSGEVRDFAAAFAAMAESLRKSRAAVERSEKRLAMAYRAARLWIWEHRLDTGVVSWRDAQQGQHTTTFRVFLRYVHPEDRPVVLRSLRAALQGGSYAAEYRISQGSRQYVWVYSWGQVTAEEIGGRRVLVGVTADVSANKEAERLRAEKEGLTASAEMASALAHEINNPLTAVTGSIYMARTKECTQDDHRKYLAIADEQARRIANIVRQLVSVYRPMTEPEVIDVGDLLGTVLDGVSRQVERKHLSLQSSLERRLRVQGYVDELRHAFTNLLTNAVESSEMGSTVRVRARQGRRWRNGSERGIRVTVADRGPGIDREQVARVFEPFVGTKAERGTGLGLWVTRSVVLKHGGSIRLRSRKNPAGGTCVVVFLPLRLSSSADSQAVKIA